MRVLRILFPCIVVLSATTTWAQYGLYGSPEMLRLPQMGPQTSYAGYPTTSADSMVPVAATAQAVPAAASVAPPAYPSTMPPANARPLVPAVALTPAAPGYVQSAGLVTQPYYAPASAPSSMPGTVLYNPALPASQGAGVVDQMLQETGGVSSGGCYSGPLGQYSQAVEGACAGECQPCLEACRCPWYAQALGLVMSRDKGNRVFTTYETGTESHQLMSTDLDLQWRAGGEIRFGRRFCCGTWAVEATYWTLSAFDASASMSHPSHVSTPLDFGYVDIGTQPATDFFDHSEEHRLWRHNEFQNIEVNLVRNSVFGSPCVPWAFDWTLGARFFRFRENLTFGALCDGGVWGGNSGQDEAYLVDDITNNLAGLQIGFDGSYNFHPQWRAFVESKFGIYNNRIQNHFRLYRGDGLAATIDPDSGVVGGYPVDSTKDALSFLTQIDLGLRWNFTQNWSATIGYRVVAATGIGLADNQIPFYIVDVPEIANIKSNGHLVLHGAFAGIAYNF